MCDIRSWVASLFRPYSCCSNNNTMQSNSSGTEVEDVAIIIEPPENTGKKVHKKYQTVLDSNIRILNDGKIKCEVCKCELPSIDHISAHIEGKQHENNLKLSENITCSEKDKQTTSNHDTVSKNDVVYCKVCERQIDSMFNYSQHVTGKSHMAQLKKLIEELEHKSKREHKEVQSNMYDCELCNERMNINDLFAHINTHRDDQSINTGKGKQHENNLKLSENTTCLEKDKQTTSNHDTVSKNDVVYCKVCERLIDSMFNYSQHVTGKSHKAQLKKLIEELEHKSKHDHKEVQSNMYDCELCNERMNINDLFAHINTHRDDQSINTGKGKQHENNLNQPSLIEPPENTDKKVHEKYQTVLDSNIRILDDGKIKCKVCKCDLPSIGHISAHVEGKQHENNLKLSENTTCSEKDKQTLSNHDTVLKNDVVYCKVCERQIDSMFEYSQHVTGKSHRTLLKKLIEELEHESKHDHKEVQSNMYDCELCNERMNINDLFAHINTHRDDQSINTAEILYKCVCCKSIIDGNTSFICHMKKKTHLHNFRNFFKHTEAGNIETHATNKGQNASEENNLFVFTILSPKVKNTSAHFEEKCIINFDKVHYSCTICREKLSGTQSVILHCETKMHQLNIEQLFSDGKVENNNDSAVWSLLNCFYELSIINSNKKIEISDASDTDLTMSNAVYKQIMEKIKESPLISYSGTKSKRHIIKPKEKLLTDRLNKPYYMKYFQLEKEMYTLSKKKIDEIKLYFKFYILCDKHIYCMVCKTTVSKNLYLLYEHTRLLLHRANVEIENNTFIEQYIKIDMPKDEKESTQQSTQENSKKAAEIAATCQVCKVPIKDVATIMLHIKRLVHKQNHEKNDDFVNFTVDSILKIFNDLYYNIQRFTCVECSIKFTYKMEFLEHIYQSHKNILQKKEYMFDFCIPCATLWFSKFDSYEGHCNDIVHKYLLKSNDFMVEEVPKRIINMLKQVDGMMQLLLKETKRVTEDHVQEEVRKSLEMKAKLCYSQAKAFLFGSRYIGLGFTNCDIDIYIDTGNKYSINNNEENKELLRIQEAISIDEDAWEIKEMLLKCRVPIIKLIYKPRNLDCDVSFLNGLSVEKSNLLRSFNNACLPCKKLTLFIKKWLSFINLRGGHGFSNYVLYWLVIYYLQEKEHLPSVAELIKGNGSSEFIGDWQIGFASVKCKNNHEDSVTVLLQGFFEFYGNFDYQSYIVCPLMGSLIAKTDFTDLNKLPRAMDAYIKHLKTNSKPEFFRIDSPLCVQDPLVLSHNATKAVSSITLKYFRQYCKECAAILKLKVN